MIRNLQKRGNSHALVVSRDLMEQLNITPESPLQLVVSDGSLIVTPVDIGLGQAETQAHLAALRAEFGDVFERLAQ